MSEIATTDLSSAIMEKVLLTGDLAKLTPAERLSYYDHVCDSLGLNKLTQPFQYIMLNGKLTLYARRDCTDQLRKIHSVSIKIVGRDQVGAVYVVTAQAIDKTGRTDESTGAVTTGNLQGDALANALMKAETKAKRRVTLSICGLGMLDESEAETIPNARFETPTPFPQPVELPPKDEPEPEPAKKGRKKKEPEPEQLGLDYYLKVIEETKTLEEIKAINAPGHPAITFYLAMKAAKNPDAETFLKAARAKKLQLTRNAIEDAYMAHPVIDSDEALREFAKGLKISEIDDMDQTQADRLLKGLLEPPEESS